MSESKILAPKAAAEVESLQVAQQGAVPDMKLLNFSVLQTYGKYASFPEIPCPRLGLSRHGPGQRRPGHRH